ncbi:hypothetical protein ACJX0J_029547, partial [Zea mays]
NEGKPMVVRKHLSMVAFNNITRLAFGKRFMNANGDVDEQGREFKTIVNNGIKIGASLSVAEFIWYLRWLCPLNEELYKTHNERRDRLTMKIIDEHAKSLKESGAKQHFVDALFTLKQQYDLSEDTVIGLLWDMITAGMDTTVISVEWAMAELVRNPRVQKKLQEELDRVVGRDRVMLETDFQNLPYLQAVVKESLRLHPPTPLMLPHKASSNVKIGGYNIPKGANVMVNVWAVARDPKVWSNPLEYRPERFLEENIDIKGSDFRVLPFGAGRRVCPGAQLGINLVASMIGHLLHHFEWSLPEGTRPEDVNMMESPGLVTFMGTPLQAVVKPRLEKEELYNRVPPRIKKIMQTDEDVGKIAQAVPVLVSKALELFLQDLCDRTYDITIRKGVKTVGSSHLKQCIQTYNVYDFLREVVSKVPDIGPSDVIADDKLGKRRKAEEDGSEEELKRTRN